MDNNWISSNDILENDSWEAKHDNNDKNRYKAISIIRMAIRCYLGL